MLTRPVAAMRRAFSSAPSSGNNGTATTGTGTSDAVSVESGEASDVTKKEGKAISFMEWYEGHLSERPVVTKMITGAILWGLGDVVAQLMPVATAYFTAAAAKAATTALTSYDWPRTARASIYGSLMHAPIAHLHYNFLEWLTVKVGATGYGISIFKAFMEQFVYWSWVSNAMYHAAMGMMQGKTAGQVYHKLEAVLWETQKAQWVFWIPIQLLNFQFVPVRHQLNVVLLTSIVWTALLSAWYPPEPQSE